MHDNLPWDELDRYFSGKCSREIAESVAGRLADDPEYGRELAIVRCIWEAGAGRREFDTNAAWRRAQARVEPPVSNSTLHRFAPLLAPVNRQRRFTTYALVASVFIAVAALVAMPKHGRVATHAVVADLSVAREYRTTSGGHAEAILADGSRIELNVASHLRVSPNYGVTSRDVYLDGEGYFDVRHDAARPFRVHAGTVVAEDVGTTFVVRAYAGESATTVAVAVGEVALRSAQPGTPSAAVRDGQVGRVSANGDLAVLRNVDAAHYFGWMEGRLEFRDTPLPAVARELERWYGVQITIADSSLARATVTASFTNQSLTDVLHTVAQSLGARYSNKGGHVRFYTSGSKS